MAAHGEGRWKLRGLPLPGRVSDDVVDGLAGGPLGLLTPDGGLWRGGMLCGGVWCIVYVPNRRTPGSDHYHYKLAWLAVRVGGRTWLCGDVNIAPACADVSHPAAYVGHAAATVRRVRRWATAGVVVRHRWPDGAGRPTGTTVPGCSTRTSAWRIDVLASTASPTGRGRGACTGTQGPVRAITPRDPWTWTKRRRRHCRVARRCPHRAAARPAKLPQSWHLSVRRAHGRRIWTNRLGRQSPTKRSTGRRTRPSPRRRPHVLLQCSRLLVRHHVCAYTHYLKSGADG